MVTLNGITLKISEDDLALKPLIERNKIAGTARTKNHNLGLSNITGVLQCWVNSVVDWNALKALVGTSGIVYIDMDSNSYTVSITGWKAPRKPHLHRKITITIEEDE